MSENTNNENTTTEDAPAAPAEVVAPEVTVTEDTPAVVEPEAVIAEAPKAEDNVIVPEEPKKVQHLDAVGNGAIGVKVVEKTEKKAEPKAKKEEPKADTVAIHSTRNVTWQGVGKVYFGYNIVTKEQADQWLTRNHVRLATPEEVAKEFGK
jgi:hypothetical protein